MAEQGVEAYHPRYEDAKITARSTKDLKARMKDESAAADRKGQAEGFRRKGIAVSQQRRPAEKEKKGRWL